MAVSGTLDGGILRLKGQGMNAVNLRVIRACRAGVADDAPSWLNIIMLWCSPW
jgi:hypothetical protein